MFKYEITERVWLPEDTAHERDVDINRVAFHGTSPDDCVRIFGLYLDGAIWDPTSECLHESRVDERFSALPEVKIMPVTVRKLVSTYYPLPVRIPYLYLCFFLYVIVTKAFALNSSLIRQFLSFAKG